MIKRETGYAFVSSVVYALGQWLLITALIKSGGVIEAGIYALGMAIVSPVLALSNLNLRAAQVMDSTERWSFGQYYATRIVMSALGLVCCLAIGWFTMGESWQRQAAFTGLVAYRFLEALSDIVQGHFQRVGQYRRIATAYFIKSAVGITLFWLALNYAGSQWLGFLCLAGVSQLVLWGYELRILRQYTAVKPLWSKGLWLLVKETAPLGLAMVVSAFQLNTPRYFLEHYVGTRELGIFAAMAYLVVLANFIGSAVGNAVAPAMGRLWDQGQAGPFRVYLWRIIGLDVLLGALAIIAALAIGPWTLRLLYNHEVAEQASLLPWFGLVAMVSCFDAHFGMAVTAMKGFRQILQVHFLRLLVVTPLSALMIKTWGLAGGAYALVLSYGFSAALFAFIVYRRKNLAAAPAEAVT